MLVRVAPVLIVVVETRVLLLLPMLEGPEEGSRTSIEILSLGELVEAESTHDQIISFT